jgi:shikimate kinase
MDITFDAPLASAKYAKWTCDVLAAFHVKAELGPRGARVHRGRGDSPAALDVSGDWSAMGVWTCLGFLTGSRVRGANLRRDSGQADEALVNLLTPLAGAGDREVDVEPLPDQFMNLAVVAAHRQGRTRLTGAANLRVKECDRIAVTARELRRLGVHCDERADGLDIEGVKALRPAVVDPEGDHRVAIAFALAGLLAPGIEIADAGCVSKSYPTFWDDVELVRASTRCVAVAGMRGAGKSTFARALAARTGREWLDTDQAFERARGPIDAFVKTHGWDAFRAEEARLVEASLAPGRVVSLGGGAVESAATRARLRERALVVWLDARAALLRERIPGESASRPSVTGAEVRAELETLLTKRRPLYAEVSNLRVPAELETEAQVGLALSTLARPCRFPGSPEHAP